MLGRGGGTRTPKCGFGDRCFTIETTPLCGQGANLLPTRLLDFAVRLVLAALRAELFELETLGGRLLILHVCVVPILALSALKGDDFTRHSLFPALVR